jgi:hypothetical protein
MPGGTDEPVGRSNYEKLREARIIVREHQHGRCSRCGDAGCYRLTAAQNQLAHLQNRRPW